MGLKNRKGFVHTLEAVIAASLLITTASVVIPQLQPDTSIEDNTQENIFQGLQTLDKTGELRSDLSTTALKEEIKVLNPNEFNTTILLADTDTETFRLKIEEILWSYVDRVNVEEQEDWEGDFNQTSADRNDNSGNLGLGYLNGTKAGQSYDNGLNDESLAGYWRMDNSADEVIDYSGEGNNMVNNGATRGTQGVFSTSSFEFLGNDDTALSSTTKLTTDSWTVTAWIKPNSFSDYQNIVGSGQPDGNYLRPGGYIGTNSGGYLTDYDGSWIYSNTALTLDTWYFVGFQHNSSEVYRMFINGEVDKVKDPSTSQNHQAGTYYLEHIGQFGSGVGRHFDGKVDELRVYNHSLSEKEIRQLYFAGRNGFFEGNYSDTHDLTSKEVPEKIQVNSSNIDSGNISWVKIKTSEGESDEFKLDSGTTNRNYTLGFSQAASKVDVEFNFSVDNSTPINTPVINKFKLWTNDTSDRSIEFDKEGDSVKSQIFVDETEGLNISYDSNLIAENITESKYVFKQTENSGTLSFSGNANVTVDITNKTIKGNPAVQDNVKNVNYPIYQNGSKEVTVSTWN